MSKYQNFFNNLKEETNKEGEKILLIDAMNMFIRNFTIKNQVTPNGHHVGGMVGFLISLGYVSKLFRPDKIYIAFEGEGSSLKRKFIYPKYKANRNLKSLTKWQYFETKKEEDESLADQLDRLMSYLHCLPVVPIMVDGLEGDDVIGYISKQIEKDDNIVKSTIISADQDFLQLISNKTQIYSPRKRQTVGISDVIKGYGTHPNNFIIKKVIEGDSSDNVPGVRGIGPKKILKHLPELLNEDLFNMKSLYDKCDDHPLSPVFTSIKRFKHQLDINHKLMTLRDLEFSEFDNDIMDKAINSASPKPSPIDFMSLVNSDLINNSFKNPTSWINNCFNSIK